MFCGNSFIFAIQKYVSIGTLFFHWKVRRIASLNLQIGEAPRGIAQSENAALGQFLAGKEAKRRCPQALGFTNY